MNAKMALTLLLASLLMLVLSLSQVNAQPGQPQENSSGETIPSIADLLPMANTGEGEVDNSAPDQPKYPGVANREIKVSVAGQPAASLYYPEFGNKEVDESIREFAESQVEMYQREVADSVPEEEEKPSSYDMWEMTGFFSLERPNPNVVSVTFNIYSYSGGAHGNLIIRCLNYDLATGRQLSFAGLFVKPEVALEIFSELSARKLAEELGDEAEPDMIASGAAPEESNFSNLTLVPTGLYIEFQPYQVGPWAIGPQRVEITLEEMAAAGPRKEVWPNFSPQK